MKQELSQLLLFFLSVIIFRISVFDWAHRRISNIDNIIVAILGIIYAWNSDAAFFTTFLGGFAASASLIIVAETYRLRIGKDGLGYGDIKLAGAAGIWVGLPFMPLLLLISSIIGLVGVFFLFIMGRSDKYTNGIPFGPFLGLGLMATLTLKSVLPEWIYYFI